MTRWWEWLLWGAGPLVAIAAALVAAWQAILAKAFADSAHDAARDTDKAAEKIKAALIGAGNETDDATEARLHVEHSERPGPWDGMGR